MSIDLVLERLQQLLTTCNPSPDPPPKVVKIDYAKSVNTGDFPLLILHYSLGQPHSFVAQAQDAPDHTYTITLMVILGIYNPEMLPQVSQRCRRWPEAIFRCLAKDVTLGGLCRDLGQRSSDLFMSFQSGLISYNNGNYFGLTGQIPITELLPDVMVS